MININYKWLSGSNLQRTEPIIIVSTRVYVYNKDWFLVTVVLFSILYTILIALPSWHVTRYWDLM